MDKDYYLNQCNGDNQIGKDYTKYGYKVTHVVEDKFVTLYFNQYANHGDVDDELVDIEVRDKATV